MTKLTETIRTTVEFPPLFFSTRCVGPGRRGVTRNPHVSDAFFKSVISLGEVPSSQTKAWGWDAQLCE